MSNVNGNDPFNVDPNAAAAARNAAPDPDVPVINPAQTQVPPGEVHTGDETLDRVANSTDPLADQQEIEQFFTEQKMGAQFTPATPPDAQQPSDVQVPQPDATAPLQPPAPAAPDAQQPQFTPPGTIQPPTSEAGSFIQIGDQVYTAEQVQHLAATYEYTRSVEEMLKDGSYVLQPNPAASGGAVPPPGAPLAPGGQGYPQLPQPYTQPPSPYAPQPQPGPYTPAPQFQQPQPIDWSAVDQFAPGLASYMASQEQRIQAANQQAAVVQQGQQQLQQSYAQIQQSQTEASIRGAREDFVAKFPGATPEVIADLEQRAAQMQIVPALIRQHNGDSRAAVVDALERTFWMTPEYRDQALNAQLTQQSVSAQEVQTRRANAARLGGPAAAIPRSIAPIDPSKMSPAQKQAAMAEEIRQSQMAQQ
jgi:hypothetical protein